MSTASTRAAEVIIVGGGPAGAVTALLLARAGRDVLLIDRARFPRPKPCGDCLSAGATSLLRRLDLLNVVRAQPHSVLHGWRIVAPDGSMFEARFERSESAIAIDRAVLDHALLSAACAAGVRVRTERVTDVLVTGGRVHGVATRSQALRAPVIVGADGLRSIVAARLGLRRPPGPVRKVSLTWHLDVEDLAAGVGEMHSGDGFCAGVACVSESLCNLTVVADSRRFGRALASAPHDTTLQLIARLPRLAGRVPEHALRAQQPHASGPFDRPVDRVATDGAVLVGDAAGYYDPFTGQGVFQAMASAELLAPCITAALENGRSDAAAFADYVRGRRRVVRGARLVQRAIEVVLARPTLATRMIARIGRAPAFAQALIAVTGDVERPFSLLSPRALSSFLFPVPEMT